MIVYEFYLRPEFRDQAIEALSESFYKLGNVDRKVDGATASAVYAVSRNPATSWVQLLVDDKTTPAQITAIEARINQLSDGSFAKYSSDKDREAPMERPRTEVGI